MKYLITIGVIFLSIICGASAIEKSKKDSNEQAVVYLQSELVSFCRETAALSQTIGLLDSARHATVLNAQNALLKCRLHYKRVSFFLDYYFPHQARVFNAPAKYEAEEPYMEYEEPQGMQLIESLLFDSNPVRNKGALIMQAAVLKESAAGLPMLLYNFSFTAPGLMESARIELIRIMALYIEGYDAPFLKSGIDESAGALLALRTIVEIYASGKEDAKLFKQFDDAIKYLKAHGSFDAFDRLTFLTQYAVPLEKGLHCFIAQNQWYTSSCSQLDYNAGLFNGEILPLESHSNKLTAVLGEKLFFDKSLSGNETRSCATCHQPDKFFADGLAKNKDINSDRPLKRNTPSLYYCAFQSTQFWDGRAKDLQTQIVEVLNDQHEMNSSAEKILAAINNANYKPLFARAFQNDTTKNFTVHHAAKAIASFLQTLAPMNSAFDRYVKGDNAAMTALQKQGFNLFTGKAQCATCHFVPLFNGSTPPFFNKSEYEVLGTPGSENFARAKLDADNGRYAYFPIFFYKGAFKTPTLRNIRKTAPYMHNGEFSTTQKVIEFYNKGGGDGLKIKAEGQTLSAKPLGLSKKEMVAIDSFLTALTDKK
ncbi:cytochrome c peroxidase [Chitinophagaceae bacterium 26-R-25]|nr:cytochrome c peroxidase [Chitinophagaceae bacterium 26-R-25]